MLLNLIVIVAAIETYIIIFWKEKVDAYNNCEDWRNYIDGCIHLFDYSSSLIRNVNNELPPELALSDHAQEHCDKILAVYSQHWKDYFLKTNIWNLGKIERQYNNARYYTEFFVFIRNHAHGYGDFKPYELTENYTKKLSEFGLDYYKILYVSFQWAMEFDPPTIRNDRGNAELNAKWFNAIITGEMPDY